MTWKAKDKCLAIRLNLIGFQPWPRMLKEVTPPVRKHRPMLMNKHAGDGGWTSSDVDEQTCRRWRVEVTGCVAVFTRRTVGDATRAMSRFAC